MAVPSGASFVNYNVWYYNGDDDHPGVPHIEINMGFETVLPSAATHGGMRELWDQALAAAFLAFRDTVESAYPGTTGGMSRTYSGPVTGDPFPPVS